MQDVPLNADPASASSDMDVQEDQGPGTLLRVKIIKEKARRKCKTLITSDGH